MLRAACAAAVPRAVCGSVAARVTVSTPSASFASEPTYDYRRLKRRSAWLEPEAPDAAELLFPRSGHGKDIELNWALNALRVTPLDLAYRNLHLRGLRMLAPAAKDPQGRVVVPAGAPSHQSFLADEEGSGKAPAGFEPLPLAGARLLARNVRAHLSSLGAVFVHDGAVGSGEAQVLNRAVTDSPAHALALAHVMQRARLGEAADFQHDFVTLLADGATAAEVGLPKVDGSFSVLLPAERLLVVGGRPSVAALVEAQAAAANALLAAEPSAALPLARSHVLSTAGGRSVLFGHPEAIICAELFSAHNSAWGERGIYRSFSGVVSSNIPKSYKYKAFDLVEDAGASSTLTTPHTSDNAPCLEHPTSAVFVVNDKKMPAVSKGDVAKAVSLFSSSAPVLGAADAADRFGALLDKHGTAVYLVNASKGASQVTKSILAATNGEI